MAMVAVPDRKQHGTFVLCRLVKNLIQARKRLLMKLIIFLLLQIGKRWHNFWTKYWKSGHSDLDSVSFVLYLRMPCRCFQHSFVQTILVQESSLFCFLKKNLLKNPSKCLGKKILPHSKIKASNMWPFMVSDLDGWYHLMVQM